MLQLRSAIFSAMKCFNKSLILLNTVVDGEMVTLGNL